MFDQIDAAYYRMRAKEERERATHGDPRQAIRHRMRADLLDRKASAFLGAVARSSVGS